MTVEEEAKKLLEAGFIEPCNYPDWLANVVMVSKTDDKWRMCIDFTNLKDACPKDCYPLPRIDQMVDATSGHDFLSFMDANSDYHQVMMSEKDKHKTTFITSRRVYNYRVMPFDLKNVGATFQRLMDYVFKD